jgi:hypothetical protein
MGEILEITERIPEPTSLPDGTYTGIWGGYVITLSYDKKTYELKTKEGVRGFNIKVVVTIKDGVASFVECNN